MQQRRDMVSRSRSIDNQRVFEDVRRVDALNGPERMKIARGRIKGKERMTNISRLLVSVVLAASQMMMLGPSSQAAQRTAPRRGISIYDGNWSVLIQTTRGSCPPAFRAGVRILGGRVLPEDQNYQLNGEVASSGAVRVTVSAGGQSAGGFGRLSRDSGRGLWRTRSGECSGQWTAARRA